MPNVIETCRAALQSVLNVGRGTSGRLILELQDEKRVRDALNALSVERKPYAWEVVQDGRTHLVSADEFTRSSFDRGSFKPLFDQ